MDFAIKEFLKKDLGLEVGKKDKERELAKKAWKKLEELYGKIENLLYPDSSPADMYEAEQISRTTRRELIKIYRVLNKIKNYYLLAKLKGDKSSYKLFFNEIKKNWKNIKNTCKKAIEEALKAWEKEFKEEKESYFG